MQIKNCNLKYELNLKSLNESGFFAGYASVFNIEDNHKDIILAGAFKKSLNKKNSFSKIKLLWQHKADEPIGVFNKISEDKHGLYVEGNLLLSIQRAREAFSLMKSGALEGLSIGFIVKDSYNDKNGTRIISEAELWEISLVTFPANNSAKVTVLKSENNNFEFEELESLIEKSIDILKTK